MREFMSTSAYLLLPHDTCVRSPLDSASPLAARTTSLVAVSGVSGKKRQEARNGTRRALNVHVYFSPRGNERTGICSDIV